MTGEILYRFNPFRDLSNKAAEGMWRDVFDGLVSIFDRPKPSPEQLLGDTMEASRLTVARRPSITGKQLSSYLEAGCHHFISNMVEVFHV